MEEIFSQVAVFLNFCRFSKNLGEKTITAYRSDLELYANYVTLHPGDTIMDYISALSANHKTSTIKRHLASIKQFFKYVYRNNRLENPLLQFEFKLKTEKTLPRTIPVHSVKKLLTAAEKQRHDSLSPFQTFQTIRNVAILDLLCSTGIRIGEAAAIRLMDIDLRTRIILIHGKGKKERLIYLSCAETVDNLKAWISFRKALDIDHDFLFVNRNCVWK